MPTVPGMELIPWSEAGLDASHGVVEAIQRADGVPFVTSRAEIDEWVAEPHFDPGEDAVVAAVGGQVVGYAVAGHAPSGERLERVHLQGGVLPDHRGTGIGSALLEWQIERGREHLAGYDHDLPKYIRTWEYDFQQGAHRLFEDHGMVPVRWFEELIRPVDPIASTTDVSIVPWESEHSAAVLAVKNAAFADHWGSTPTDPETWGLWMDAENTRLDLSFVALDGDEIVGFALNGHYPADEEVLGRKDGWIESLGVSRSHRGRGIASALIARSVAAFAEAGFDSAMLGVDSANPTGARGLYERLGFEPLHRAVSHELVVD